jgi:hypothetical protein
MRLFERSFSKAELARSMCLSPDNFRLDDMKQSKIRIKGAPYVAPVLLRHYTA